MKKQIFFIYYTKVRYNIKDTVQTTERSIKMKNIVCEAYGKCDLEEYLNHYRCTKCGKIVPKR